MNERSVSFLQGLGLVAAMVSASVVGAEWAPLRATFSPVAPAPGVGVAALIIGGSRMLPWVVIGAVIGRLTLIPYWPPLAAVMLITINALSYILVAAHLRLSPINRELSTLLDVKRFLGVSVTLASVLAVAPIILLFSDMSAAAMSFPQRLAICVGVFFGRFCGVTILGAAILTHKRGDLRGLLTRTSVSSLLCLIGVLATTTFVFGPLDIELPIAWLVFPALILAAFIGESSLTAQASLIVSIGAVWGTTLGWGPFSTVPYGMSVLQQFLCVFSATGLVLAGTAAERRDRNIIKQRADDLKFLSESAVDLLLSADISASIRKFMPSLARQCRMDLILYHSCNGVGVENLRQIAAHGFEAYSQDATLLSHIESRVKDAVRAAWPENAASYTVNTAAVPGQFTALRVFACFPVLDGNGIRGVLSVGSRTRQSLEPGERTLVETVVSYLRSADRRMHEEAERTSLLESERAARTEAERADRVKNEFLAVLSHELRNPLNAIVGWTHLLLQGAVDTSRAARIIDQSARLQSQLIEDLLDMSRIKSGKLAITKSQVDLSGLVASACDSMQVLAREKGIELEWHLEPGVALAMADAVRINQVVINLLSNALKFTPREGRVSVVLGQEGGDAVLTVTDTGEGIPEDFLPHIFERFKQVDASTTRRYGGLGLGLSIAKHITELHGGTISAHSPGQGKGATFSVRLPLQENAAGDVTIPQPGRAPGASPVATALAGRSIVIVEDDAATAEFLARTFSDKGSSVITCERGAQALEQVRKQKPDLIISDIGMPDMDGYELIRRVRQTTRGDAHLPAIAVSAFARSEDVDKALKEGFDAHISKPVDLDRLQRLASELLTHNEFQQAEGP